MRAAITDRLGRFELRRRADAGGLKRAAVAVVVVEARRAGRGGLPAHQAHAASCSAHGGQWALPGGRVDAGETIEQTALRELHEELGVLASTDDILGTLDDYPTRSGYLIAPVVVWSPGVTVTPNPAEVAAAYRIACGELFREGSPEIIAIEESDRPIIRLPLPVANVNAPTAAVLYQFREVALAGRDTRVDHFEQPVFAWRLMPLTIRQPCADGWPTSEPGRRFRNTVVSCSITCSPRWLIVTWRMRAMPRSGLDAESRSSTMSVITRSVSPGPHRPRELDFADARRAQAAGAEHALLEPQLQGHRHGVQARRDQAAEGPLLGELDVGVERLRIPLARELDDAGLGQGHAAAHETVADLEVFVIAIGHGTSSM